ncbi:MAG: hypothetical protein E7584_03130 [Ruminococcaceae bacterium]|nr:hypothetical protein [Oscillospiraceae bacterium]
MRVVSHSKQYTRRLGLTILLLVLSSVLLVSCMAGPNALWIRGLLGLDVNDYFAEAPLRQLQPDGTTAALLSNTVTIVISDSIRLTPFSGTGEAVRIYRDAILNDMLRDDYSRYTGNRQAIDNVSRAYPYLSAATLISKDDFENVVFRYFGGTSVSHKSGEAFSYLSRADYYTSPLQARECIAEVNILELYETEHTYRMQFVLTANGETSDVYTAVFVKRSDGSCYWKALR